MRATRALGRRVGVAKISRRNEKLSVTKSLPHHRKNQGVLLVFTITTFLPVQFYCASLVAYQVSLLQT